MKVLNFLAKILTLSKPRKATALTRETTRNLQSKSFMKKRNKIATYAMRLSQVSLLSKAHSVLRIQYSSPVQTISKVRLEKSITKRCNPKEFYLHPLQLQILKEFISLIFKKFNHLKKLVTKLLIFKIKSEE